jgi:hypothetical protein
MVDAPVVFDRSGWFERTILGLARSTRSLPCLNLVGLSCRSQLRKAAVMATHRLCGRKSAWFDYSG